MAVYAYECAACGEFEAEHSMKDKLKTCPSCGASVKRLISSTTFKLRGGGVGWSLQGYHNDGCLHVDLGDITPEEKAKAKSTLRDHKEKWREGAKDQGV